MDHRRTLSTVARAALVLVMVFTASGAAQTAPKAAAHLKKPAATAQVDAQIAAALKEVSPARIRATIEKLVGFGTRHTLSAATPEAIASGRGVGAAREWIRSEYQRYSDACGGCLKVEMQSFTAQPNRRIAQPTELVNVVATMTGTDPEQAKRVVLISGHYDTICSTNTDATCDAPGANDDGSGTAVSLEAARVLSKHKFPVTIVFMAVPGEEQGLVGSTYFAKQAKAQNWNIEAVFNNDIVGGNRTPGDTRQDAHTVRVFSEGLPLDAKEADTRRVRATGGENDSSSRELARYIAETGRRYLAPYRFHVMMVFRPDRYLRGGDHTPFNEQGYAAVRFSEFREDYHHQHQNVRTENGIEYGDLPKFVDFDYVANVARANIAGMASLASAPPAPRNVRMQMKLENDTTLTWEAVPGAARYQVLWRATTAPDWEQVKDVGDVTTVTLEPSKDNVIFAVRAVDKTGHASLPVVPSAERPQQPVQ